MSNKKQWRKNTKKYGIKLFKSGNINYLSFLRTLKKYCVIHLTLSERVTHWCVVEDFNMLKTSPCIGNTEETFLRNFVVILKRMLQNYYQIVKNMVT